MIIGKIQLIILDNYSNYENIIQSRSFCGSIIYEKLYIFIIMYWIGLCSKLCEEFCKCENFSN